MTVKDVVRRLQALLGPINRLPSWLNEMLGGAAWFGVCYGVTTLAARLTKPWPSFTIQIGFAIALALAGSAYYEHRLDPWGYNPVDVLQRIVGIVLGALIVSLFQPGALAAAP